MKKKRRNNSKKKQGKKLPQFETRPGESVWSRVLTATVFSDFLVSWWPCIGLEGLGTEK